MHHYIRLFIVAVLSFISMYVLMYAMVDRLAYVYPNLNQFYMAGLMTAPMVVIKLLLMSEMFKNRAANVAILAVSVVALAAFWFAIRAQTAVADGQFIRSMIPHHSGAILMCERAALSDPELKELCAQIIRSQQEEIDQMQAILARREQVAKAE